MKERKIMIGRIESWLESDPETAVDILAQLVMGDYTIANMKLDIRRHELVREYEKEETK
jgi:hypothetical protein